MRLHKTGHPIADTVSGLIGDFPDGDYRIGYGILRGSAEYLRSVPRWFELDKGFTGAAHYDGFYRLSYKGTQPLYSPDGPHEKHDLTLDPWQKKDGYVLVCPPTDAVCEFFNIDYTQWMWKAARHCDEVAPFVRIKGDPKPIDWTRINKLVTFNSTVGIEALRRGIPVVSDEEHSTIGSYTKHIGRIDNFDRSVILDFIQGHQFKLMDKGKIWELINYYLSSSDGTLAKP